MTLRGIGTRGVLAVLLGVTLLTVSADALLKRPCVTGAWADGFQYRNLCYNDLQALYYHRGLSEERLPYVEEFNEYPVLTGMVMFVAARLSDSDRSFFVWNLVILAGAALVATTALWGATRGSWRVLLFAAAPSVVVYAAHNWDLLAVAFVAGGLYFFTRERWGWSGAAFGFGVAAKLFPLAALPVGVVALLRARRRSDAAIFGGSLIGAWAACNVPFMLANWSGWFRTWSFHSERPPDFGTPWYWIFRNRPDYFDVSFRHVVDRTGLLVLALTAALAIWLQVARRLPMANATALLVCAFLLVTKVHSPQYALWLLPFYVVVRGSWPYAVSYAAVDLLLFVAGFRWIAQWPDGRQIATRWQALFVVAVFARAAVLLASAVHFIRSAGSPNEALDGEGGSNVELAAARRRRGPPGPALRAFPAARHRP